MLTTTDILDTLGDTLIADLVASQKQRGLRASGRSADSTRKVTSRKGSNVTLRLLGVAYWRFQERGRGPGKYRYPSRLMVKAIAEWVAIKGLSISPYAIAMKINRDGIRVPNRYNAGGVLSDPLNVDRVRSLLKVSVRPALIKSVRSTLFR